MRYLRALCSTSMLPLLFLSAARSVAAQSDAGRLASVQVDLWPDYDRPAVLVLITAQLLPAAPLPATLRFSIPAAADQPSAVAYLTAGGDMYTLDYDAERHDDATMVTFQTPEPAVRLEFYYPYERLGDTVRFDYSWSGGIAADDLTILFQQPLAATAVSVSDGFIDLGVRADGRRYHQWLVGPVGEGDTRTAVIQYGVSPGEPAASAQVDGRSRLLPVILVAGGGLLLGAGVGWFLGQRRRPAAGTVPRRTGPGRARPSGGRPAGFCRQCGAHLRLGDAFCRQCGGRVT